MEQSNEALPTFFHNPRSRSKGRSPAKGTMDVPAEDGPPASMGNDEPLAVAVVDGQRFRLCATVESLCEAIQVEGRGVLRFRSLDFGRILGELKRSMENQPEGRERDVFAAPLACAGCMWEFPVSYMLSLQSPGLFGGNLLGAIAGFDAFGKTGVCPQCGSGQSLLVYESFPPEKISRADVEAIRRYWQSQSRKWWEHHAADASAACDRCSASVARGEGYLNGSHLYCDGCVNQGLMTEGLERLRRDPHYYGSALLRKARAFPRQ
jgi:hypothetical protein